MPSSGRVQDAVRLPNSGPNFEPYADLGVWLGRTYVHSRVASVVRTAYVALETAAPGTRFVYGESGLREGGRIAPHRTHQNGLAVDFMVPVVDAKGRPAPLPRGIGNRYGYDLEFDAAGRLDGLRIDFEAVAEHLHALHIAATAEGIAVSRVIFDRAYLPALYATARGAWIREYVTFMQGKPWIRHDEHYHVDFETPCRPLPAR